MKCFSCKSDKIVASTETYFAQINNCYIIIENVPCQKCLQCGEVFYSVSVIEKIESTIDSLKNNAEKVCIMDYTQVAA